MNLRLLVTSTLFCLSAVLPFPAALNADGEIQIDGVPVVSADQGCAPGSVLAGFNADGSLLCTCTAGLTDCAGRCMDLQIDPSHCGACEQACRYAGDQCVNGACRSCDFLYQDCPVSGHGCYPYLIDGETLCASADPQTAGGGLQGDPCEYTNECAAGYGCLLPDDPVRPVGLECARLCDPNNLGGPRGIPRCENDAGAGFSCVRASDFFPIEPVVDDVGFCIGPEWM